MELKQLEIQAQKTFLKKNGTCIIDETLAIKRQIGFKGNQMR